MIDVVSSFRLNFLGDEASGTRLFGTQKDYLSHLKGKFLSSSSLCASKPLRNTGGKSSLTRYPPAISISEESGGKTPRKWSRRGKSQSLSERRHELLYKSYQTEFQGLRLLRWGIAESGWDVSFDSFTISPLHDLDVEQEYALITDAYSTRVVLLNYREDGITPFVTIWKYGLTEMKV